MAIRRLGFRKGPADNAAVDVRRIRPLEGRYQIQGVEFMAVPGDAPKDYIVHADGAEYIAKAPRREGPIECVTEYLISRIGAQLPLRVALGRLVCLRHPSRRPGERPDVRFLSRQFLERSREQLVHGSQVVAHCFEVKEKELEAEIPRRKEWSFYTVELIGEALDAFGRSDHERKALNEAFARMMAFDALVGANDRHPHNWGVVQDVRDPDAPRRFAPIFDTARGLFWNHAEDRLRDGWARGLMEEQVERYAMRSVPLIAFNAEQRPNHFQVVEHMLMAGRGWGAPIRAVVRAFDPGWVRRLLHAEFGTLLSRERLEFCEALLRYRHDRLKASCSVGGE